MNNFVRKCPLPCLYRVDSRPPVIVYEQGFSGCNPNAVWRNPFFGSSTVFTSQTIDGARKFLNGQFDLFRAKPEHKSLKWYEGKGRYSYLYKIDAAGLDVVFIEDLIRSTTDDLALATDLVNMMTDQGHAWWWRQLEKWWPSEEKQKRINDLRQYLTITRRIRNDMREVLISGPVEGWRIHFMEVSVAEGADVTLGIHPLVKEFWK